MKSKFKFDPRFNYDIDDQPIPKKQPMKKKGKMKGEVASRKTNVHRGRR